MLDRLVRSRMRANHEQIAGAIRDAARPAGRSPRPSGSCTLSVVSQCVFYRNSAAVVSRLYPELVPAREIERIADHVTRFSLAAIRGLAATARQPRMTEHRPTAGRGAPTVRGAAVAGSCSCCGRRRARGVSLRRRTRTRARRRRPRGRRRAAAHGAPPAPVPVVAEPARSGDIRVYLDGLGTVTPLATVTVRSRVDGQLMAVHFQEGQMVQRAAICSPRSTRGRSRCSSSRPQGQLASDQALLANAQVDLAALPRARGRRTRSRSSSSTRRRRWSASTTAALADRPRRRSTPRSCS